VINKKIIPTIIKENYQETKSKIKKKESNAFLALLGIGLGLLLLGSSDD
jgi:hypothetical protein